MKDIVYNTIEEYSNRWDEYVLFYQKKINIVFKKQYSKYASDFIQNKTSNIKEIDSLMKIQLLRLYFKVSIIESWIEFYSLVNQKKDKSDLIDNWGYDVFQFFQSKIEGRVNEINDTTKKNIQSIIRSGELNNKSKYEIARDIKNLYKSSSNRALVIATTETTTASNFGVSNSVKYINGTIYKKWWHGINEPKRGVPRNWHIQMQLDDKLIRMNELFLTPKGNMLLYPGDPSAPAIETINCKCRIITQSEGGVFSYLNSPVTIGVGISLINAFINQFFENYEL